MPLYNGVCRPCNIFFARLPTYIVTNITLSISPSYRTPQYIYTAFKSSRFPIGLSRQSSVFLTFFHALSKVERILLDAQKLDKRCYSIIK